MNGSAIASLVTSTALAGPSKGASGPMKGRQDFSQTFEQALNRETPAGEVGRAGTRHAPDETPPRRSLVAESRWREQSDVGAAPPGEPDAAPEKVSPADEGSNDQEQTDTLQDGVEEIFKVSESVSHSRADRTDARPIAHGAQPQPAPSAEESPAENRQAVGIEASHARQHVDTAPASGVAAVANRPQEKPAIRQAAPRADRVAASRDASNAGSEIKGQIISGQLAATPAETRHTALASEKARTMTAKAEASPALTVDKPAVPVTGAQLPATTATTSPAAQVAEAAARDLQELAPSRVAVSTNGTPNRPVRSIQLQLNPAELGTVNIRLQSVEGELRITIKAESEETARMLSRDSETIRSALRAAGIASPEITVSVNRNETAPQQFAGQSRDASGQQTAHDNRGTMSNESRNPNRESFSGGSNTPYGNGDIDSGGGDRDHRIFI